MRRLLPLALACSAASCGSVQGRLLDALQDPVVSLAVDSAGHAWIATESALYRVEDGLPTSIGAPASGKIAALSILAGKPVLIQSEVLYAWENGTFRKLLEVPLQDLRLAAADGLLYILGTSAFVFHPEKGHQRLFDLPSAADCATAAGGRVYYSIGPAIYSFAPGGKLTPVAVAPGVERIHSMAMDPGLSVVYLNDGAATYALQCAESRFVLLTREGPQLLAFDNGALHVLSPFLGSLVRVPGISAKLARGRVPASEFR